MKLPVSKELKAIVKDTLTPVFSAAGYTHRGTEDYLCPASEDLVRVVSLQQTSHPSQTFTSFTLNLGVFDPIASRLAGHRPATVPSATGGLCSLSVAALFPERKGAREFWYDLGTDGLNLQLRGDQYRSAGYDPTRPASLRSLLRADLEGHVLPFMQRLGDRRSTLEAIRARPEFRATTFALLALEVSCGEVAAARKSYQRWQTPPPQVRPYVLEHFAIDLAG
jgi:hypothetical protein